MTHALRTPMLRVTTAICAVAALGTTPAWAQDAAPAIELPGASAPVAPTIQLPTESPAPPPPAALAMVSQPVVQQAPPTAPPPAEAAVDEPAPAPRATERRADARAAPAARSEAAPQAAAPAQTAPAPVVAVPAPVAALPAEPVVIDPVAAPPPPVTEPAPDLAVDDDAMTGTAAIAALLLALGIGGAWLALRTRRRRPDEAPDEAVAATAVAANEPTGGLDPQAPLPAFATVEDVAGELRVSQPAETREAARRKIGAEELVPPTATTGAATTATAEAMPDSPLPQTRAERDALLERMAAAPPSAENPFTSRKARLRRARLILQAREYEEQDRAAQPFDWRTYRSSTSHPAPATPPRVTA